MWKLSDGKDGYDGYIEIKSGVYPIYQIRRFNKPDGDFKEWICVDLSVFKELMDGQVITNAKDDDKPPIMELKRREEDNPVRQQIAINLEAAISKRTKRGEKTKYLMEIASDYGYPDVRSLQNAMNVATPKSLTAEDILYFENEKGIHRDEILGGIDKRFLYNIQGFRMLHKKVEDDPELKNSVNGVLRAINDILSGCSKMESERKCNSIKKLIEEMKET